MSDISSRRANGTDAHLRQISPKEFGQIIPKEYDGQVKTPEDRRDDGTDNEIDGEAAIKLYDELVFVPPASEQGASQRFLRDAGEAQRIRAATGQGRGHED
jgi:hypothetical protein